MAIHMNFFRVIADLSHTLSKCILIWAIHSNKSAEGVSLLTQLLYVLVFVGRYLDLLWVPPSFSYWNFVLKIFYISSSVYIIVLMLSFFPRTREREKAWRLAAYVLGGSVLITPIVSLIFKDYGLVAWIYTFSLALESVCILPQLLLLRQTTVPTVLTSGYLILLGSYRFFYLLNWLVRALGPEHYFAPVSDIFGVIQTALYVDFAWVYWTRQRVKLRGGGVVDSDDLRKSWFVGNLLRRGGGNGDGPSAGGSRSSLDDEDDSFADVENQNRGPTANGGTSGARKSTAPNRWGKRGVSVSADDTLAEHERDQGVNKTQARKQTQRKGEAGSAQERAGMLKPDSFEVGDDEDDDLFAAGDGDGEGDAKPIADREADEGVLNSGGAWKG